MIGLQLDSEIARYKGIKQRMEWWKKMQNNKYKMCIKEMQYEVEKEN